MIEIDPMLAGYGVNSTTNIQAMLGYEEESQAQKEEAAKQQRIDKIYETIPWVDPNNKYNIWTLKREPEKEYASVTPFLKEENQLPVGHANRHMKTDLYNAFTGEMKHYEVSKSETAEQMEEEKVNYRAL